MNNTLQTLQELCKNIYLLYVEDEDDLREIMVTYLRKFFPHIDSAKNGEEGLNLYQTNEYDLVITDILMPKLDGLQMSEKIKKINDQQNIIIISAYADTKDFIQSIKLGIDGYVLKPINFEQLNTILFKIVEKIHKFKENIEYQKNLESLVLKKTKNIQQLEDAKIENYKETIYALVQMIEKRDTYTGGHSLRVAQYSKLIAQELNLDSNICENIYLAGILHDIGKIAIPDNVLLKPSMLDDLEYTIIKEHVQIGVDMLEKIPLFKDITNYIKFHHERLDGSGYPNGIKGDNIPLESQILAISDVFDAMTTNRIYKGRKTPNNALEELSSLSNIHFRSEVVTAASKALKNITIDLNITQLPHTNIEKERFSYFYKDQITQAYNSSYLDLVLIKNTYDFKYKYLYMICIHNLNNLNEKRGWKEGDKYLKSVYLHLEEIFPNTDIFRVFSDDFTFLTNELVDFENNFLTKFIPIEDISFNIEIFNIKEQKIFSFHDLELIR